MRKHYLDNIRWITVVVVVIYHVLYMYNAEGIPGVVGNITGLEVQYYDVFQYLTFPWFMFLLFIVSGISSRCYLEHHTGKEFLRSRTRKLLVPSTLGLFAFQFIQGYFNTRSTDAMNMMRTVPLPIAFLIMVASGIGVLWYIQLLWVFSIFLILIRKIEKNRLWKPFAKINIIILLLLSVPVFGAAQILNTPIICVYRFGYYGLAFLLGYFVFSHEEVIEILKKWSVVLIIVSVILGIAFSIKYFGENYADTPVYKTILFTTFGWFASLAWLGAGAKYLDYTDKYTSWMNRHSWGIYIFHYLGISIIAVEIATRHIMPAIFIYLLSLISAFVTSIVLYELISRIPIYRWVVLGIKENNRTDKENV
ncbi:MAG: acyltransferase [Lachnospiraceae bacterium]|nr:acyltransferase [Lachnospiraceae bacterium]